MTTTTTYGALAEHIENDLLDEYINLTGGDIISSLKKYIGPTFIMGVDGACVILTFKKGMVKIHVDGTPDINVRRATKLIDKGLTTEVLYRIFITVLTLDLIINHKDNDHVNVSRP